MKKKIIALLVITTMLMALVPQTALALVTHDIPDGVTIDFTNKKIYQYGTELPMPGGMLPFVSGDTLNMEAGETGVTLIGAPGFQLSITCEEGVTLTIEDLTIDDSEMHDICALAFTGSGNMLILKGTNVLKSGKFEPGVRVEAGTSLEITDDGESAADSLSVFGGAGAAGIGGGYGSDGGNITISGTAEVTAIGGDYIVYDENEIGDPIGGGAGIGSGDGGDESDAGASAANITIKDSVIVTAYGGRSSAGIGGGDRYSGGSITITDHALVNATGGIEGAGIGGGRSADGGTITIEGGTVNAESGNGGAGIGGGWHGGGGTINISGGYVYASDNYWSAKDIGPGQYGGNGTIYISGRAAVFLRMNSISPNPTTSTHRYVRIDEETDEVAGYPVLEGWTPVFAYLHVRFLEYSANGGSDAPPRVIVDQGESTTVTDDTGMSFTGYEFVRWDTHDTGEGIRYDPGDSILMDVDKTLYAVWKEIEVEDVDILSDTKVLLPDDVVTLTAVVSPDTALDKSLSWTSSDEGVATVDSQGVVTAVGMGTATIKAETSNGVDDTCQIVVSGVLINYELSTGSVMKMSATVLPSGTTAVWTSDNESVATVAQDGTVTAIAPGYAVITAMGGSEMHQCGVVVYDQAVTSVALNRTSVDLVVNETADLTAYVFPDDAVNKDVIWTSDEENVATVAQDGTVMAVGKGSTTVTAQSGGHSASCTIEVTLPVASVSIGSSSKKLSLSETADLTAMVLPSDATDTDVTWASSDTDIVTVDSTGKVTAVGIGSATITAEADSKYDTCTVMVVKTDVAGVTLSSKSETLKKGETTMLTETVSPSGATYPDVTWKSSDESIATVDASGKVTAKSFGSAAITAEADSQFDICIINVVKTDVVGVTLSGTSETLKKGETTTLTATVSPSDATSPDVTWKSGDESIATVDASGKVTAKSFGSAAITAEADGQFDICIINVIKTDVSGISLNRTYKEMGVGDNITIKATVTPGDATYPDVTWKSTNTSVATVSGSGKVTAVSDGAAAIIADADGVYAVCAILVSSESDSDADSEDDEENDVTLTPTPTATSTASPGGETEDEPDTGDESTEVTPTPSVGKVVITIVVSELPEGTTAVKLPSGEVVELDGTNTIQIEVGAEDVEDDGSVELIAMGDEGTPLGEYTAAEGQVITIPASGSAWSGIWQVLMWVLIGIAGAGVAGLAVYMIVKKKR